MGHHDEVESFVDDGIGYLQWLAAHPDGFVMNAARNRTPTYLVLHRTGCHTISGIPARSSRWTGDYIGGKRHENATWRHARASRTGAEPGRGR